MKKLPAMQELQGKRVQSLGREDPLEEEMATPSSILAWRIPWTEEPGRIQSVGSQRVGHGRSDLARMQGISFIICHRWIDITYLIILRVLLAEIDQLLR